MARSTEEKKEITEMSLPEMFENIYEYIVYFIYHNIKFEGIKIRNKFYKCESEENDLKVIDAKTRKIIKTYTHIDNIEESEYEEESEEENEGESEYESDEEESEYENDEEESENESEYENDEEESEYENDEEESENEESEEESGSDAESEDERTREIAFYKGDFGGPFDFYLEYNLDYNVKRPFGKSNNFVYNLKKYTYKNFCNLKETCHISKRTMSIIENLSKSQKKEMFEFISNQKNKLKLLLPKCETLTIVNKRGFNSDKRGADRCFADIEYKNKVELDMSKATIKDFINAIFLTRDRKIDANYSLLFSVNLTKSANNKKCTISMDYDHGS